MSGEKVDFEEARVANNDDADGDGRTNERSGIAFPYIDLDAAADVAQRVYARSGISSCSLDELAAELKQTTRSGNFRLKTSAARVFGLIQKDGQSSVKLSDLGCRLVSPDGESEARAAAFLHVALYNQIYEKYKGRLLPPTKALEREMQTLGVASKQTEKARQIMQRAARQAGFFNSGDDRLVRPRTASNYASETAETLEQAAADAPTPPPDNTPIRRTGSSGGGGNYHPFIQGLLQTLPEPGTVWTIDGRAAWLEAAASAFTLIYQGEGRISVQPVPSKRPDPQLSK